MPPNQEKKGSSFFGGHHEQNTHPSHNNSQHVLAIVAYRKPHSGESSKDWGTPFDVPTQESILQSFSKTSALPIDIWRHRQYPNSSNDHSSFDVILASNYPNCILESDNFCALSAGFPYYYLEAFSETSDSFQSKSKASCRDSFSKTVLDFCEANVNEENIEKSIGQCLKKVSGHFSLFLIRKHSSENRFGFWAWNDPFGFMPIYHHHLDGGIKTTKTSSASNSQYENAATVLSSHWDCMVPAIVSPYTRSSLQLDWDVVAEYLTLGTTLGGVRNHELMDRTLVKGIENLCPGTGLTIEMPKIDSVTGNVNGKLIPTTPTKTTKSYIQCYGACEEMLHAKSSMKSTNSLQPECATAGPSLEEKNTQIGILRVRGVKLAGKRGKIYSTSPLPMEQDKETLKEDGTENNPLHPSAKLLGAMLAAFSGCIEEALATGHLGRAALTGGGDTRLILACLLSLQQQEQSKEKLSKSVPSITFQTHAKQKTDWQIARYLSIIFGLKHEKIRATSTTIEGAYDLASLFRREESLLSNLHDQTPIRRRQKNKNHKHREGILSYTLHGRFGTEFLGCLCFDKSPLDVRKEELEEFSPKATKWFRVIFGQSDSKEIIRNPLATLQERLEELDDDKKALEEKAATTAKTIGIDFDSSYAFQLQLYTRSCLSDIYKGLRGGSWFSIPTAMFSRNAITPFLDNTLLRIMMCFVSVSEKEEPYELYGKLYRNNKSSIFDILCKVPSNNKLLCNHTTIPRAIKVPEATARPFRPKFINATKTSSVGQRGSLERLKNHFHPIFWRGSAALFLTSPVKMDATTVQEDPREEVRALVELVGSAADAWVLSCRLQSFLLWYERRFLVHIPR